MTAEILLVTLLLVVLYSAFTVLPSFRRPLLDKRRHFWCLVLPKAWALHYCLFIYRLHLLHSTTYIQLYPSICERLSDHTTHCCILFVVLVCLSGYLDEKHFHRVMSLDITLLAMYCGRLSLDPAYIILFAVHKLPLYSLNTFGMYYKSYRRANRYRNHGLVHVHISLFAWFFCLLWLQLFT